MNIFVPKFSYLVWVYIHKLFTAAATAVVVGHQVAAGTTNLDFLHLIRHLHQFLYLLLNTYFLPPDIVAITCHSHLQHRGHR